jgi:hypothetical protein
MQHTQQNHPCNLNKKGQVSKFIALKSKGAIPDTFQRLKNLIQSQSPLLDG